MTYSIAESHTFWRIPRALATVLLVAGLIWSAALLTGCVNQQRYAADTMAAVVNSGMDVLVREYEREGNDAIERATTVDGALSGIAETVARWRPVWSALATFAAVHAEWATAIESGRPVDIAQLLAAYCRLKDATAWLDLLPSIPLLSCKSVKGLAAAP